MVEVHLHSIGGIRCDPEGFHVPYTNTGRRRRTPFGRRPHGTPHGGRRPLRERALALHRSDALLDSAAKLFEGFTQATLVIGKIDELESEADAIEQNIIERAFAGDMDGFAKIMLRDLVKQVASVSDRAENVGDRISIIVAKRNV